MSEPTFSLLITTYNSVLSIKPSMRSLLSQINDDFEVVVVDNLSNDGTEQYLKHLADQGKIRLISVRCNRGEGRQIALENAKGKYVIAKLDMDGIYNNKIIRGIAKFFLQKRELLKKDFVLYVGVYISTKELLLKLGGWKDLQWGENYELNKRLIEKAVVYMCPINVAKFHVRPKKISVYQKLKKSFQPYRDSLRAGFTVSTVVMGIFYLTRSPFARIVRCYFMFLLAYPLHFLKPRYDTFNGTGWKEYYVLKRYSDKLGGFEKLFPDKVFDAPTELVFPEAKYVFFGK